MIPRTVRLALISTLVAPSLFAQQPPRDANPVDVNSLLQQLQQIEERNLSASKSREDKILREISGAASSNSRAIELYEQAYRATSFAGQANQAGLFQEWKKKHAEQLRSVEMQTAARLHLQYLHLTLQRSWGKSTEELLPQLFQYTHQLMTLADDKKADGYFSQELLRKGVNDSVFSKWYHLQRDANPGKEWELSPGNLNGIYEKSILPVMRAQRDARIVQYWDLRIEREGKQVTEGKRTFNVEQFNNIHKPTLLWNRAQDLLAVGLRNSAINEMLAVIKNYPDHPDTLARIAALKKVATPPAPAPVAKPEESAEGTSAATP